MMLKENSLFLSHRLPTVWLGSENLRVWSTSTQHIETEWALERMAIYHNIDSCMVILYGAGFQFFILYVLHAHAYKNETFGLYKSFVSTKTTLFFKKVLTVHVTS